MISFSFCFSKMDQSRSLFVYFCLFHIAQFYKLMKAQMVQQGLEPGAAGLKAQTNPLSHGETTLQFLFEPNNLKFIREQLVTANDDDADQCDQIGSSIGLWATFQSLWQQLVCPNLTQSQAIFVKVSKSFILLVKSFLGNFYSHFATFYWSH